MRSIGAIELRNQRRIARCGGTVGIRQHRAVRSDGSDDQAVRSGGNSRRAAGFRNDFSYKGINLSLLFSARFGGIVVSPTQGFLDGLGVSKASADARDAGGVPINNGRIDAQHYYETVGLGQLLSHYTYSATNVRLQETSIGYTFPKKWMGDRVKLTASLVGRNLWMIYCKAPFDPELTASTGSYLQGIDYFMQPSLRSLGFNVQLKF